MHEYDIALKAVLRRDSAILTAIAGAPIARWHNPELPEVRGPRVDLLGERNDGGLVHVELQSTNDRWMAVRMADYALAIFRGYGRFPEQTVLYVGEAPMRMEDSIRDQHFSFRCRMLDIRDFDGDALIASPTLEDNVVAILAGLNDRRGSVRRILSRIAAAAPDTRAVALAELTILAGLRSLDEELERETKNMPILNDIREHKVLGREYRRGEADIILRQIERRFGDVPGWARARLEEMPRTEVEDLGLRLLDANTLEDLFAVDASRPE